MEEGFKKPMEDSYGTPTSSKPSPTGIADGEKTLDDIMDTGSNVLTTGLETGGELVNQGVDVVETGLEGAEEILDQGLSLAKNTAKDTGKFMLVVGIGLMLPFVFSKLKWVYFLMP